MKSKNLQDQGQILGESKENFCHKNKIFERESPFEEKVKSPPSSQIKSFEKSKKKIGCHNTYPLRKNLVLEISADPQIDRDTLLGGNLPFPM